MNTVISAERLRRQRFSVFKSLPSLGIRFRPFADFSIAMALDMALDAKPSEVLVPRTRARAPQWAASSTPLRVFY
jgi:hypothetical protein